MWQIETRQHNEASILLQSSTWNAAAAAAAADVAATGPCHYRDRFRWSLPNITKII